MINIPTKSSGSLSSDNILSINHTRIQGALTRQDLTSVNRGSAGQTPCTLHGYEAGQTIPEILPAPGSAPIPDGSLVRGRLPVPRRLIVLVPGYLPA